MNKRSVRRGDSDEVSEFLGRHLPFSQMQKGDRQFLVSRLTIRRFGAGEVILTPEDGPARQLFIVRQGRVGAALRSGAAEEGFWDLIGGDCFPIGALLAGRPVSVVLRAEEETSCFALEREDFDNLRRRSPELQEFCMRRLASLLDGALHDVQARLSRKGGPGSLAVPLRSLVQRDPVVCDAATPLNEALARMRAERVGSIVAVDAERRPVGIFTLHDLLDRVALRGVALSHPFSEVMTSAPAALEADDSGFSAALLVADRGFGHVCVTEGGRLVGVLSERDLFSLRRIGLARLRRAISEATAVADLAQAGAQVPPLIDQMLAQGASVEQITEIITALNDHLTRRAVDLVLAEGGSPGVEFSWLAFGSEGRREQTLKTDQDNGILFVTPPDTSADEVRALLLPVAERVGQALSRCGLPLCSGGVMASNPQWCLSAEEWARKFADWVSQADGKMLLYASIFFDFRCLYGPEEPVEELRQWLLSGVRDHRNFFRRMTDNALGTRPPLGLLRDFLVRKGGDAPNTLDLKLNGITPFVDAGRIFALNAGISATNTPERLREAGKRWRLDSAEVDGWVDAFNFIQLLRLRRQHEQLQREEEPTNRVDPDRLSDIERRALKDAFRQARKLQKRLERYFQF